MSARENYYTSLTQASLALTDERLTTALTRWFAEHVTFTHWEYVSETGKGDSYLSEIIRIKIYGKSHDDDTKHVQVILKNIPKSLSRRLTFRSDEFFRNEINFYEILLPALLQFQSSKKLKDPFDNYPKVFLSYCDGANDVICLEDAGLHNFRSYAVRQEAIDFEHSKVTLRALAKFHAISFAMRDQEPQKYDVISNAIFETYYHERLWDWYEKFWARICSIAIDSIHKEYPNTIYVEKIKKFAVPETYLDMIKATRTRENGVISHGDSWTNNFLYKYDDANGPVDAKIIDFQLTRNASPVLDVSFMIYACTTEEMRRNYYHELLKYYYNILSAQIKDMGSDPDKVYSWKTFMDEVKKYSYFGLAFSFESTPTIVLEPDEALNMDMKGDQKLNINDIWQLGPIKTKEGRLREANNIKHCVDNGYI